MSSCMYRYLGLSLVACFGLSGCMEGGTAMSGREGSATRSTVAERDVEDPRTFSRRENGLWDGRPSFGGVWVAHPDAKAPERVIIRNIENGRETVGSLFTRERMNPGPPFQVSGEAAAAVGLLAGAPTMIEVVALRAEEPAAEAEPAPKPETEIAAASSTPPAASAPEPAAAAAPSDAAVAETLIAMPTPEAAPPRQGLLGRLFGRGQSQPDADDRIENTPLDATGQAQAQAQSQQAPTPMPMPSPAAAAQAPDSTLERPYIQLGIFSVEANAGNAERMARDADLPVRVISGSAQGNRFWRVVVGPANDAPTQARMLARVRALGFNDAYMVRR